MTDFLSLPTFASRTAIHVVVETPRQAQAKFKYDPTLGALVLSRALTLGLTYPYDWGFVPSTSAPDGDPRDALVLHNVTTNSGMILCCKPIGILNVLQAEGRKTLRNDRVIVVPVDATSLLGASDIRRMPASLRHQAEEFFTAATAGTGKKLKFLGWGGPRAAMASIRRARETFEANS